MIELKGKPVAHALLSAAAERAQELQNKGVSPKLFIICTTNDSACERYAANIGRQAARAGLGVEVAKLAPNVPQALVEELLGDLSLDPAVHGILLMRPLAPALKSTELAKRLAPPKDVDGMGVQNLGKLFCADPRALAPATARAVLELLDHYGYDVAGRSVCVLGRSLVAGRPIQALLTARDATVTLCHSRTKNVGALCRRSELIVSCVGKAGYLTKTMVAPGAWVVDVGINAGPKGQVVGDVDRAVAEVAGALSPVPGGLGAATTAVLILQTIEAAGRQTQSAKRP